MSEISGIDPSTDLSSYDFYGVRYAGSKELLEKSTSGGAFLGIAEFLLSSDYHVCAAVLDAGFEVRHIVSKDLLDLEKMQGSKYVQSNLGEVFHTIKQLILDGDKVFFCGCPCQVVGLRNYIGDVGCNANLITMDFACHGVAAPGVLDRYLEWRADEKGGPVRQFEFKVKNSLWGLDGRMWRYLRLDDKLISSATDPLAMAYLSASNYRESCYSCQCKFPNDGADFVVGDFVKADKFFKGEDNSAGLSFLFCRTDEAKRIWDMAKDRFWYKHFPANDYIGINRGLWYSANRPVARDDYYRLLQETNARSFFKGYLKEHATMKKRVLALRDRLMANGKRGER